MDTILQAFLSWQFLFFCIALGAVVFVIRQVVEYAMKNWWPLKNWAAANSESKVWRDLVLPILPIVLGQVAALLSPQYPYPEGFSSLSGRIVFGLVAGFSSGLIVKLYKSFLASSVADFAQKVRNAAPEKPKRGRHDDDDDSDDQAKEESVRNSINKDQ